MVWSFQPWSGLSSQLVVVLANQTYNIGINTKNKQAGKPYKTDCMMVLNKTVWRGKVSERLGNPSSRRNICPAGVYL